MPHKDGYITAQHDENFKSVRFYFPIDIPDKFNVLAIEYGQKFTAENAVSFVENDGDLEYLLPQQIIAALSFETDIDGKLIFDKLHQNQATSLMAILSIINKHSGEVEENIHNHFFID